jgi:hypothetical protein
MTREFRSRKDKNLSTEAMHYRIKQFIPKPEQCENCNENILNKLMDIAEVKSKK